MRRRSVRAVVAALKREKLVDGGDGGGISRSDADLRAAGEVARLVRDAIPPFGHESRSRNFLGVDESRDGEVAPGETVRDLAHVRANGRDADTVGCLSLEFDSAAVRPGLEAMPRCVLIDAHRLLAARLKRGERRIVVRARRRIAGAAGDDEDQPEDAGHQRLHGGGTPGLRSISGFSR